ncbi:Cof-type HAD-IIB family hydrolase [Rossellomorea marisflavi]|uniref:Cof-type HAD-IIB family hydrolase n=1 Tax=Rossellomorea marisflavi TaxID=189381 RepID=UPI0025C87EED|nr:Cof-type HAD-IIB family hydrolase [Rossellomorea marisflavi]GLI84501.1 Cof-type HAD-IIB family hydrolase [Rossellomorea marisflavi]
MITSVASDMDGTLLNEKQEISEGNKEAILKAQQAGIEVIVATGRSYEEASYVVKEAGIDCDIICANGAEVRDADGEIVYQAGIGDDRSRQIAAELNELGIYFEVYTNQGTYTEDYEKGIDLIIDIFKTSNPDVSEAQVRQAAKERYDEGRINVVEDYEVLFEDSEHLVFKFLVFSKDREKLQQAQSVLTELKDLAVSSSGKNNLEINSIHAQKGVALEKVLSSKGLNVKDAMAIGDNLNDLSMMKVVGRPVAMGNGLPEVKEFCSHVTATNREDGVAKAILEAMEQSEQD